MSGDKPVGRPFKLSRAERRRRKFYGGRPNKTVGRTLRKTPASLATHIVIVLPGQKANTGTRWPRTERIIYGNS